MFIFGKQTSETCLCIVQSILVGCIIQNIGPKFVSKAQRPDSYITAKDTKLIGPIILFCIYNHSSTLYFISYRCLAYYVGM